MNQDLFAWPEVVDDANIHGPLSFAIPSSVAGYAHMHGRWGVLPLSDVMAPALALAKRGLSQDWFTTLKIASSASVLRKYAESASIYLPGGLPPVPPYQGVPGYFRQGNLADTLDRLAHAGLRDFYEGDVAATLVDDFGAVGSVLTAEDLRRCEARVLPVMEVPWHGRTIQLPIGLTAGPTFRSVLEGMREVPSAGRHLTRPGLHGARADNEGGLCRTTRWPRRDRAHGGRELHHPSDGL